MPTKHTNHENPAPKTLAEILAQRLIVVSIGFGCGLLLSLLFVATEVPPDWGLKARFDALIGLFLGPFLCKLVGLEQPPSPILYNLGIVGLLCVFAHPIKPNIFTAFITIFGILVWFLASFDTAMATLWGA